MEFLDKNSEDPIELYKTRKSLLTFFDQIMVINAEPNHPKINWLQVVYGIVYHAAAPQNFLARHISQIIVSLLIRGNEILQELEEKMQKCSEGDEKKLL